MSILLSAPVSFFKRIRNLLSESRILADYTDFADFGSPVYLTPFGALSLPVSFVYKALWYGFMRKFTGEKKEAIHGGFTEIFLVVGGH